MDQKDFQTNLIRLVAAQNWLLLALQTGQALFGKPYPSLSVAEKGAVDQMVLGAMASNFHMLTPDFLDPGKAQWLAQAQPASPAKH